MPGASERSVLLGSLPEGTPVPGWWSGRAVRTNVHLVISPGAVSLNNQALRLMEQSERERTRCLTVLAPHVSDEAFATLLVNDAQAVFPDGILPLQLLVPEFHVEEVLAAIAVLMEVPLWDGRADSAVLARIPRMEATEQHTTLWLGRAQQAGWIERARGLLQRSG